MKCKLTFSGTVEVDIEEVKTTDDDPVILPPLPTASKKAFYGVNAFPWVPMSKLAPFGSARCYVPSHWIWQPDGLAVQPMSQAETTETRGIDDWLTKCKASGIEPLLCIHQTPEWFLPTGNQSGTNGNDRPPAKAGSDLSDPKSYREYAELMRQITIRYGRVKFPESEIDIDDTPRWPGDEQTKKSGGETLDLLRYIEPWNEPEKWWLKGKPEYFEPEHAAALLLACYTAIKSADPSMQVVMPGITDFDMNYISKMHEWFVKNNAAKWPCDVINVHHYSNSNNVAGKHPQDWSKGKACRPVLDKAINDILPILNFARSIGLPVWVTEFGADTNTPSNMAANSQQEQADIILETFAFYKGLGIQRAFVFNAVDEDNAFGMFNSSGISTSQKDGYKPKAAFQAIKKATDAL